MVSALSAGVSNVCEVKSVLLLVQNEELVREMRPFDQWSLPPSVDTDVIHVINDTRPSPSIFAYCKRSKTGRWEGLGTKLCLCQTCARGGTQTVFMPW